MKPQAKKAKVDAEAKPAPKEQRSSSGDDADQKLPLDATKVTLGSLVAYDDDDDDDESGDDQDWQRFSRNQVWIPQAHRKKCNGRVEQLQPVRFARPEAKWAFSGCPYSQEGSAEIFLYEGYADCLIWTCAD